ncbi:hypothetical protein AAMO2058_000667900 [Amorphochlora amoebiformis]
MTTAHKPTFHPAIGTANPGGYRYYAPKAQYSSRDLPGHLKLKTRGTGQGSLKEIEQRDLKAELVKKEKDHFQKKEDERRKKLGLPLLKDSEAPQLTLQNVDLSKYNDEDDDDDDDDSDDSDDSDDDNEQAELERELARIRKEREEEKLRKQMEAEEAKANKRNQDALKGNPLLNLGGGANFTVKKRWYEDVVFRNQARDAPKAQKTFVNDTIRNSFHRKFLSKYMK